MVGALERHLAEVSYRESSPLGARSPTAGSSLRCRAIGGHARRDIRNTCRGAATSTSPTLATPRRLQQTVRHALSKRPMQKQQSREPSSELPKLRVMPTDIMCLGKSPAARCMSTPLRLRPGQPTKDPWWWGPYVKETWDPFRAVGPTPARLTRAHICDDVSFGHARRRKVWWYSPAGNAVGLRSAILHIGRVALLT